MIFHEATEDRSAAIADFLRGRLDRAMFPLSNLTHHGMGRTGRYQMRFWLAGKGDTVEAALGLSAMGMLLPVLPVPLAQDLTGLRTALAGERIAGIIGPPDAVQALFAALNLPQAAVQHQADEPGFALDLADLVLPDDPALTLRSLRRADRTLLVRWRAAYRGEVTGTPPDRRAAAAAEDIDSYLAEGSHRLLLKDGVPVAMTGFNAALPEAVQIGGVYTPPELRGHGYARAAVALHLAEARAAGVPRAVLFAANDQAARAYRAIGFRPSGRTMMMLFHDGTRVGA
jgi:RimJ/RimL family protein N-acetyltransferase